MKNLRFLLTDDCFAVSVLLSNISHGIYRCGKPNTTCVYGVVVVAEIDIYLGWFIIGNPCGLGRLSQLYKYVVIRCKDRNNPQYLWKVF